MRRLPSFAPFALTLGAAASLLLAAPAAASFRLEKTLPLAPGGELVVETAGGGIVLTGGPGDGAKIVITSERDREDVEERYTFEFSSEAGRAKVINRRRPGFSQWFNFRSMSLDFKIEVPRNSRVDLRSSGGGIRVTNLAGAVKLRSSGGGVRAFDVDGPVDASSSGGGVEVRRVRGDVRVGSSGGGVTVDHVVGNVAADSSGGGVEVSSVSGDVAAESSGGGVHLDDIGGRIDAESSGGPVSAVLAAEHSAGGRLSSSGGGVRVGVDRRARLHIDASSSGGGVTCDLPLLVQGKQSRSSIRGDLNGGGAELVLRSSGGGIRIRPSDERDDG